MDEMRLDLKNVLDSLGTFSSRLGETERGLDRVYRTAPEERSSKTESASEVRSATVEAASKGDVGEEDSGACEKLLQVRKVSEGVMEGVRGRPTPDASSLSPTKRLERAMRGLAEADDVEVQRSPQQVRRRAAEIADEVAEESWRVQEAIADRGRVLVDRYGYEGAVTRILEMFAYDGRCCSGVAHPSLGAFAELFGGLRLYKWQASWGRLRNAGKFDAGSWRQF